MWAGGKVCGAGQQHAVQYEGTICRAGVDAVSDQEFPRHARPLAALRHEGAHARR